MKYDGINFSVSDLLKFDKRVQTGDGESSGKLSFLQHDSKGLIGVGGYFFFLN